MLGLRARTGVVVGLAVCLAVGAAAGVWPTLAQAQGMGPRDVAEIPIESVPAWVSEGVSRYTLDPQNDYSVELEVLAVIRDPRDIPADRFLYAPTGYRGEVLVHPQADAIRSSLGERGHSAVAVYVRTKAPDNPCDGCIYRDPFDVVSLELNPDYDPGHPWPLGVSYGLDGIAELPCLSPAAIGSDVRPFTAPDTGKRIRPDEYLPPIPQYTVRGDENLDTSGLHRGEIAPGEVREGWVMCLAPDVPVDQVRLGGNWTPFDAMAVGEWMLLKDRQVMGWNSEERPLRWGGGEPTRVDEQVVYEGDVWITVAQALRHRENPRVGDDGTTRESLTHELIVQMYFDGMDDLLRVWDELEVPDVDVAVVTEPEEEGYRLVWGGGGARQEEVRAEGQSVLLGPSGASEPLGEVWAFPVGQGIQGESGPIVGWRVAFEEIDERDLTTDEICAQTECISVPVGFIDEEVGTLLPVIPPGTQAFGVTVQSARFLEYPHLENRGLDMVLNERDFGSERTIVIEVDAEGMSAGPMGASFCGISSGYYCLGDNWEAWARSGGPRFLVFGGSDDGNARTSDLTYELTERGPVFRLP